MVLLDMASGNSLDADSVTSHDDRLFLPMLIQECCLQSVGILCAELENMTQLDCLDDPERRSTNDARLSILNRSQIVEAVEFHVSLQIDVCDMVVVLIRA